MGSFSVPCGCCFPPCCSQFTALFKEFSLTVSGLTNAGCTTCGSYNGTFTLSSTGTGSPCDWRSPPILGGSYYDLSYSAGTLTVTIVGDSCINNGGGTLKWTNIVSFDPCNSNTLNLTSTGACTGAPATVTITPVSNTLCCNYPSTLHLTVGPYGTVGQPSVCWQSGSDFTVTLSKLSYFCDFLGPTSAGQWYGTTTCGGCTWNFLAVQDGDCRGWALCVWPSSGGPGCPYGAPGVTECQGFSAGLDSLGLCLAAVVSATCNPFSVTWGTNNGGNNISPPITVAAPCPCPAGVQRFSYFELML